MADAPNQSKINHAMLDSNTNANTDAQHNPSTFIIPLTIVCLSTHSNGQMEEETCSDQPFGTQMLMWIYRDLPTFTNDQFLFLFKNELHILAPLEKRQNSSMGLHKEQYLLLVVRIFD